MSAERLLAARDGGVLTLTLNRPDKRNALDSAMVARLAEALAAADIDAAVDVIALKGAGKDFCAGADLDELLASVGQPLAAHEAHAMELGRVFIAMRKIPKPIVAVVHGRALAGGCGLATACDLVVARDDAAFGYPEVKRGFVPAMVMAMLTRSVSEKIAFDLVATGRTLSAGEAHDVGLVSRVLPAEGFDARVSELLSAMAASSGSALALIKQQLYNVDGRAFEDAIALGAQVNAVARSTPEFKRAVEGFLKK